MSSRPEEPNREPLQTNAQQADIQLQLMMIGLQQVQEAAIIFDSAHQIRFINAAAQALLGIPPNREAEVGPAWFERICSSSETIFPVNQLERTIQWIDEKRQNRTVTARLTPLTDQDGKLLAVLGLLKAADRSADLTARLDWDAGRPSEVRVPLADRVGAVAEQPEVLEAVIAVMDEGVLIFDGNGTVTRANASAIRYFGQDPTQMSIQTIARKITLRREDGSAAALEEMPGRRALRGEKVILERWDLTNVNGEHFVLLISASPLEIKGQPAGAVVIWANITQREAILAAFQKSEERLKRILESIDDAFFALDSDWRFRYVNRQGGQIAGRDPADLLGKSLWELWPQFIGTPQEKTLRQAAALGQPIHVQFPGLYTPRHYEANIYPSPDGVSAFLIDKTEFYRQEQALKESEARFRRVVENIQDAILIDDIQGRIIFVNDRFLTLFGFTQAERSQIRLEDCIAPDYHAMLRDRHERRIRGETVPAHFEFEGMRRDGTRLWLEVDVVPVHDEADQLLGTQSAIRDVTGRKRAEKELQDRAARLELLSTSASTLLKSDSPSALLDQLFRRLTDHLSLEVYIHYALSQTGAHLQFVSAAGFPEDRQSELAQIELGEGVCGKVAATGLSCLVENVQEQTDESTALIRSLGLTFYVCHPLMVHNRLIGTLSFGSRTVTRLSPEALALMQTLADLVAAAVDRKRAEIDLQQYSHQLEQSNQELQDFAYVASHDLQEPLRKIEAFSDRLHQSLQGKLSEEEGDYIARMLKASHRMQTMIKDLLELSRITSQGKQFQWIDLNQVAENAVSDLEDRILKTGAHVEIGKLPSIEADPNQMERLLVNLISNGLKYHREGVAPFIRVSGEKWQEEGRMRVEIRVEDNGIGFDMQFLNRIFQPFQRLHGSHQYEGTGMGLAICKKIVERHAGTITAQSEPGKGSIFIVQLNRQLPRH